jgi:hypothetical protein
MTQERIERRIYRMQSRAMEAVAYEPATLRLLIAFNHATYVYDEVPQSVVEELLDSKEPGRYFQANIRGRYEYERLEKSDE